MRKLLLAICISSAFVVVPATAQVNVGINTPSVSIGVHIGTYPQLVPIPGYPVYYAPQLNANYFFYDGMYWTYSGDNWYTSAWYDGPWLPVEPVVVPVYILRVPVRYYRLPPPYFRTWAVSAPPHWGEHWGPSWEERRRGWDRWDRRAVAAPAPLPTYQRQYSGGRYPQIAEQQVLQQQHYRYRPNEAVAQQYYRRIEADAASGHRENQAEQAQRAQQAAQQRQAEPTQRAQQQAQQRQAEPPQRAQQQAQKREAEQTQRAQQQAQQRQAEQSQRAQREAQQRQSEQAQHAQQQAQQQQHEQRRSQGKREEQKEPQGG